MKKAMLLSGLAAGVMLSVIGCGGSGQDKKVTKVIMDDPIAGLNYVCSSSADVKTTNSEGKFTCNVDDTVTFYIGKYEIGSARASSGTADTLRIADLGVAGDAAVTDIRQLLQTIDEDRDDGVITIPEEYDALDEVEVAPGDEGFDSNLSTVLDEPLISSHQADTQANEAYLKRLLAGKTFYMVKRKEGKVERGEFDKELSTLQSGNDTMALTLDGNKIIVNGNGYAQIASIESQYIAVKTYKSNGTLDDTMRFYFDKADADAYVATLTGGGSGAGGGSGVGSGSGTGGGSGAGGGTATHSIVGTWHQDCHHSETRDLSMRSDGTATLIKRNYTDKECTQGEEEETHNFGYTKGADTTGSHGESATELDISFGSGDTDKFYTMYRFMDNGNLFLADSSETRDGSTREKRENFFDPEDPGFVRQ